MRILNYGSIETQALANEAPDLTAMDVPTRRWTWMLGNALALTLIIVAFWGRSGLLITACIAILLIFNGAMAIRAISGVGYPVALANRSKLVIRFIADIAAFGPLKPTSSSPRFLELDSTEIENISGRTIEVMWPGSRTIGNWLVLRLDAKTEEAVLRALREVPQKPVHPWLLAPRGEGEFFLRWHDTFSPTLAECLAILARNWTSADAQIQKRTLDVTTFATMPFEDQIAALRDLNALNLGQSALLLVKDSKRLSIEAASRFIREALDRKRQEGTRGLKG